MPSVEANGLIAQFRANAPDPSAALPPVKDQREQFAAFIASVAPMPASAHIEDVQIGGRRARWVSTTATRRSDAAIILLHGGGYIGGSIETHSELAYRLSLATGVRVLVLDYRLAPEHPFPAAIEDAVAAIRALVGGGIDPSQLAVVGDSAGGGLALAALTALRDQGAPQLGAAIYLSPWVDLTQSGVSIAAKATEDPWCTKIALETYARLYLDGFPELSLSANPLFGDLSGMPPSLIQVGSAEILLSDAERLQANLGSHGVEAQLQVFPGLFHVFQLFPFLPEANEAVEAIGAFLTVHVGNGIALKAG